MAFIITIISFKWYHYLSFSTLKQHRQLLSSWINRHYAFSLLGFMVLYITAVATSMPGAALLTMAAGFMFGPWVATPVAVISASLGASIIFLVVKTSLGKWLGHKAKPRLVEFEKGFQRNAFNYLLSIRLVPLFPFWLVNIASGLLNVSLRDYFCATFLGIIPGTLIYTLVGHGLGSVFEKDQEPAIDIIFNTNILVPLLLLALLSLLPIIIKKWKHKSHD